MALKRKLINSTQMTTKQRNQLQNVQSDEESPLLREAPANQCVIKQENEHGEEKTFHLAGLSESDALLQLSEAAKDIAARFDKIGNQSVSSTINEKTEESVPRFAKYRNRPSPSKLNENTTENEDAIDKNEIVAFFAIPDLLHLFEGKIS